jgi:hypothetical protein
LTFFSNVELCHQMDSSVGRMICTSDDLTFLNCVFVMNNFDLIMWSS